MKVREGKETWKTVASNNWNKYMVHLLGKKRLWSLNFSEKIPTTRPHLYIKWIVCYFRRILGLKKNHFKIWFFLSVFNGSLKLSLYSTHVSHLKNETDTALILNKMVQCWIFKDEKITDIFAWKILSWSVCNLKNIKCARKWSTVPILCQ